MKVPLKHGAVVERGRRKKNGKGKKREKEKSSTRFCCTEESPDGCSGKAGHGPGGPRSQRMIPQRRDCKGPLMEQGSSGRRLEVLSGTQLAKSPAG